MFRQAFRRFTTTASARHAFGEAPVVVDRYSRSLSALHWVMGGSIVGCVATVKLAQNTKDKAWKGRLMLVHKSLALIVAGLLPARVAARYFSRTPRPLPGSRLEHWAANVSHAALYGFMGVLPLTGIVMGYFSGFGLPFFFFPKIPGAKEPKKALAKTAFQVHSWVGSVLVYVLPIHVGAAAFHLARGQKIFARINPFVG